MGGGARGTDATAGKCVSGKAERGKDTFATNLSILWRSTLPLRTCGQPPHTAHPREVQTKVTTQSLGEYHRMKSARTQCGLAALKACPMRRGKQRVGNQSRPAFIEGERATVVWCDATDKKYYKSSRFRNLIDGQL